MNVLQQEYCISLTLDGTPSRLQWNSTSQSSMLVFSDRSAVYAYSPDGNFAWKIPARAAIRGWVFHEFDLYVLDGNVLCQYDTSAFQTANLWPETALGFSEPGSFDPVKAWRGSESPQLLDNLFHESGTSTAAFSVPVIFGPDGEKLLSVLRSDGLIYTLHLNLSKGTLRADHTSSVPDELTLFSDGQKPVFLSGGQVVDPATNHKTSPPEDLATWKFHHRFWNGSQPWAPLESSGMMFALGNGGRDAGFVLCTGGESAFYLMISPVFPLFTNGFTLQPPVYFIYSGSAAMLPNGTVRNGPPTDQQEIRGKMGGNNNVTSGVTLDGPPCVSPDRTALCALIQQSGQWYLAKYALPPSSQAAPWLFSWQQAAQPVTVEHGYSGVMAGMIYTLIHFTTATPIGSNVSDPHEASPIWILCKAGGIPFQSLGFPASQNWGVVNYQAVWGNLPASYQGPAQVCVLN